MTSVLPESPGSTLREDAHGLGRSSLLLSVSAAAVAGVSYACGLLMAHTLDAAGFSAFAAGQTLLGVVGVVSLALIPLPLVESIRSGPRGSEERRRGMAFAMLISLILGVVAAIVTGATTALFASTGVAVAVAVAALALALVATVWGWLQGELRFPTYARSTIVEVGARLAFSVGACLAGWGAGGVLVGFTVGAVAVLALHAREIRRDLAWRPSVLRDRARWTETRGIAVTQLVASGLAAADVVLAARWGGGSAAGYAALATLAKGPVYVATGTVLVTFPMLRDDARQRDQVLRESLLSFGRLAVLAAVVLGTIPPALLGVVLPARYVASADLLPWIVAAALGHAVVAVFAIILLALRAYARAQLGLFLATVLVTSGLAGGWQLRGVVGLAVGGAAGAGLAATALLLLAWPLLPPGRGQIVARTAGLVTGSAAALHVAAPHPVVWTAVVAGLCALVGRRVLRERKGQSASGRVGPGCGPLRLLHLGFEDPAMPGAGGGARRTHEINRRIAVTHAVTVLVQRYPGCNDRTEDGVRYVHVGLGSGRSRLSRLLGYVALLPAAARRIPADLVIEDFFAPFSTMAAPRWTGRPTIGVVQWLNAEEKSRQYRVPMAWIERFGVRSHRRLIAVSSGVEERLRALNPDLVVDVIGNGVEHVPATAVDAPRSGVLFIGRLETAQKGLDLLLDAWARLGGLDTELVVAGNGPDRHRLENRARALGVESSIRFIGWLDGDERFAHLAAARLVVVPSRFETFGMVALEAFAVGTPVVAFDIPCLRDIVPTRCGRLVPAFDVVAFARAVEETYHDEEWLTAAAGHTRRFADRYDWDTLAAEQLAVYVEESRSASAPSAPSPDGRTQVSLADPLPGG